MEDIEKRFFHQTQQSAEETILDYARRVGAIKILAMKERTNERIAPPIGRKLVHHDSLVSQLDESWTKMHQV